jgi:hypothetical protein
MDIKGALTRKFGPLPAWAWLLLIGVGVYIYEKRKSGSVRGTGTGSVAPVTPTPQAPFLVPPGDGVYDPGTGQLIGGDGGDGSGTGGGASTEPAPVYSTGVAGTDPGDSPTSPTSPTPPSDTNPSTPSPLAPNPSVSGPTQTAQLRPRSKATIRRERTRSIQKLNVGKEKQLEARSRTGTFGNVASRVRNRPKTKATKTTHTDRPVATHPKPSVKEAPKPAPRPSSPPASSRRIISTSKPTPKSKPRPEKKKK